MNFCIPSAATRAAWIGLLAAALFMPARIAVADAVSDFEQMRQSQLRNLEQSIANMPPLCGREDHDLGEILRLGMEGQDILAHTPLDSTLVPGYTRAKIPGFPHPVMVRVVGGADRKKHVAGEAIVPDELLFQTADYSTPHLISSLSLSQSGSVVFSLSRTQTSPTGSRTIQFLVQKVPNLPGGGGVTLIVNESGFRPDVPPSSFTLGAPDCATFLRRHPRAAAQYLRPMLSELGQDSVFAPSALLAMQVFPENFTADARTRRHVESLLPELDAGDYHRRDKALAELEQMGAEAAKVMVYLDRATFSPEQNARVDRALTTAGLIPSAEATRLRHDTEFLLNCLYSDDPITRKSALAEIKALTGRTVTLPDSATPTERNAAVRDLRTKLGEGSKSNATTRDE